MATIRAPAERSAPDAIDDELLELPSPPQGRRVVALVLMAAVVVAASTTALSLRHDIAYFFSSGETVDLGDVTRIDPATLRTNRYVRVTGTPMISRAVRYRRVLTGGRYVVFPLAGQRTVYVQVTDTTASIARADFTGRLVTFDELGSRIVGVEGYLAHDLGLPVTGDSFIVLADETPGSYVWALLLALLCVLFVAIDVAFVYRWFRPARKLLPKDEDGV